MDTELLKTFLEVGRTRHFGKAAENLFVTQSTVSTRVRQLEDMVGAPLFVRARNDIQLTPTGRRLIKYAESILTTWNRARQELAVEDETRALLSVAGVPSLWDIFLQDWLEASCRTLPDTFFAAEALGTDQLIRQVLDGSTDLGFLFEAPQHSELKTEVITKVELVLVSSERGLDATQATRENYVLVDWGTSFAIAHAQYFADIPTPALRMGLGRMARDYLLHRGGSAYLARGMVENEIRKRKLHLVKDAPVIERAVCAVWLARNEKRTLLEGALRYFNPASLLPAGSEMSA